MTGPIRIALTALLALASAQCAARQRTVSVPPPSSLAMSSLAAADSLHSQSLAPGVWYLRAWEADGPWAIHVVEVDTARCVPRWSARKPAGRLDARATTSSLAGGALVAVNADFFQLPGGTPVGTHVTGGRVLIGPGDRPAWLWSGREMHAGPPALQGTVAVDTDRVVLAQVNRTARTTSAYHPAMQGATLFTSLMARIPPADSAADVVFIDIIAGDESAGSGRVRRVERAQADTIQLASGEGALQVYGVDRAWATRRTPGELVRWQARVVPRTAGAAPALEAVGGFPELLRNGEDVLGTTPVSASFGPQRHPRTAIGWSTVSGRVFLVVVDGRQAPYSDGMSLTELQTLFRRLGATDAMNLDGGGSTALVVRGAVQNRPSDRGGERAVGNALALNGCGPG